MRILKLERMLEEKEPDARRLHEIVDAIIAEARCDEAAGVRKDKVLFVDWNTGEESFRDMQLMSHCKHGIITNSTFGWWGAYFIQNPEKITISPLAEINTTYHC